MQEPLDVTERMRREWNERAREDAHFYVAFGRREQDDEEFFATAREVVAGLEWELRRLPAGNPRARRALEIGCGPGRLIKPMSRYFGEIHGVDVSDEMIARARHNLCEVPHAHVHATSGAGLPQFADDSFDLVYSYAVFQHIPSHEVVMQYLRDARRVLRPEGILRCQINGLDKTAKNYDTWSGVRISGDEVRRYALENDMQLLALEGVRTQYMWTTMRKRSVGWRDVRPSHLARIRRVTNAHNSEPVVPVRGRFASFTVWLERMPQDCDLIDLEVCVGGVPAVACYIGPPESDGLQQVNVLLQDAPPTGIVPLDLLWRGVPLTEPYNVRLIPPGPVVPHVLSVTDGINMLSGLQITSRSVKVTIEEAQDVADFSAEMDGRAVSGIDVFCADPLPPRFEINFDLPPGVHDGYHDLRMRLGKRKLGTVTLEVVNS